MREPAAHAGIDQRQPQHVSRYGETHDRDATRQRPQDRGKTYEAYNVGHEAEAERERVFRIIPHVFGNALIGIVGPRRLTGGAQADDVVGASAQPGVGQVGRHPAPPAVFEQQGEINSQHVGGHGDADNRDEARHEPGLGVLPGQQQVGECAKVLGLQRIVERASPAVEQHVNAHVEQR